MWDRESVGVVALLVVTIVVVVVFCFCAIDQYVVCLRGGYVGGECMQWKCFCYEVGEDGIKRFVPLPQVREEIVGVR